MDLSKYVVEKEKIDKGSDRIKYNQDIAATYERIYEDYGENRFKNKAYKPLPRFILPELPAQPKPGTRAKIFARARPSQKRLWSIPRYLYRAEL